MTKVIIDGTELDVPPEYTLLQACEMAGAEIPRFCFHERLDDYSERADGPRVREPVPAEAAE